MNPSLWQTVLNNLAGIIVACTGFGAMLGGFLIQIRMMREQTRKFQDVTDRATVQREGIKAQISDIQDQTNGLAEKTARLAREAGYREGLAAGSGAAAAGAAAATAGAAAGNVQPPTV